MITTISLNWIGPFTLDEMFINPAANESGVYLFTVEDLRGEKKETSKVKYFIEYAGYTRQSFRKRLRQHVSNYRKFLYYIFDIDQLQRGKRVQLWDWWYKYEMPQIILKELELRREELLGLVEKQLNTYRLFLAPLEYDQRILQRIEAAIMNQLYSDRVASKILTGGMRLSPRKSLEQPLHILNSSHALLGLPTRFDA